IRSPATPSTRKFWSRSLGSSRAALSRPKCSRARRTASAVVNRGAWPSMEGSYTKGGSGEWGVRSGVLAAESLAPQPDSPLPHSPLPIHSLAPQRRQSRSRAVDGRLKFRVGVAPQVDRFGVGGAGLGGAPEPLQDAGARELCRRAVDEIGDGEGA